MLLSLLLYRDGRLQESDQILAIDGQVLDSGISHEEAISILQKASGQVQLVVARGAIPRQPGGLTDQGGITPPVQQVCPKRVQRGSSGTSWQQLKSRSRISFSRENTET